MEFTLPMVQTSESLMPMDGWATPGGNEPAFYLPAPPFTSIPTLPCSALERAPPRPPSSSSRTLPAGPAARAAASAPTSGTGPTWSVCGPPHSSCETASCYQQPFEEEIGRHYRHRQHRETNIGTPGIRRGRYREPTRDTGGQLHDEYYGANRRQ